VCVGPNGRVIAADVREFVPSLQVQAPARSSAASSAGPAIVGVGYTDYPVSESSKAIAARLTHAKQVPAHTHTQGMAM
jgi:pyruvate dehydrogenase E2 component (dihydrolipoamide acetyltransferase)